MLTNIVHGNNMAAAWDRTLYPTAHKALSPDTWPDWLSPFSRVVSVHTVQYQGTSLCMQAAITGNQIGASIDGIVNYSGQNNTVAAVSGLKSDVRTD